MDITNYTDEQKKTFQNSLDTGVSPQTASQSISSATLSGNTSPVSIPTTPVSTTAAGITGLAQAQVEQAKAQQAQDLKAQEAQKMVADDRGKLEKLRDFIFSVQSSRLQSETDAGLPLKQQAVTNATNKLEASQRAQTNELRALESANLVGDAKSNAQRDINRKYAFEQADFSLIQSAANRDFSTAQSIVDRKIQLQLEPLQTQLEFTKMFYQDNKDNLTKAEGNAFQLKIKGLDNEYSTAKQELENVGKIQLEAAKNGAPSDVLTAIGSSKTQAEALKASGGYLKSQSATGRDTISSLAEQLVNGMLAPSELSKRTSNYNAVLKAADDYSMATTGKHFDISKANRDYKYATNVNTINTLNYLGSLIGGAGQTGNLDELVTLSGSLKRTQFPALNKIENWARLEAGDPTIAAYHATVTEVADQVAKILQGGGTGSGTSDAKLQQASALFQSSFTTGQLKAVVDSLRPLLQNRAKNLIGDNPYLSDYADQFGVNQKNTEQKDAKSNSIIDLSGFNFKLQ